MAHTPINPKFSTAFAIAQQIPFCTSKQSKNSVFKMLFAEMKKAIG